MTTFGCKTDEERAIRRESHQLSFSNSTAVDGTKSVGNTSAQAGDANGDINSSMVESTARWRGPRKDLRNAVKGQA